MPPPPEAVVTMTTSTTAVTAVTVTGVHIVRPKMFRTWISNCTNVFRLEPDAGCLHSLDCSLVSYRSRNAPPPYALTVCYVKQKLYKCLQTLQCKQC